MARATSNSAACVRALGRLAGALNWRSPAPGGSRRLGEEVADTAAGAIRQRTVGRQQDARGAPLKPLNPRYRARKVRQGYSSLILVRTGEMTELGQIRGAVTVTGTRLVMEAGRDRETKNKVRWAMEGSRKQNRPERRFFGLGKDGDTAVNLLLRATRDAAILRARAAT